MENRKSPLLILFLSALATKFLIFFAVTDPIVFVKYPYFAQRISEGAEIGERILDLSPFYLYLNVFFYRIYGAQWEGLALFQIIIGSFTVGLTYFIGEQLLGKKVALIAAILVILYGNLTLIELTLEPEAWVLFFNALAVLFLLFARREKRLHLSPWLWLGIGALIGLSIITKPNALLILPLALIWIFGAKSPFRQKVSAGLFLLLGTILLVSPITLRNYLRFQDFVLVTADGGKVFFHGNGPGADGYFRADLPHQGFLEEIQGEPDSAHALFRKFAREAAGRPLAPSQCSSFWVSRTLNHMLDHPGAAVWLLWKKFLLFWGNYEIHDIDSNYKNGLALRHWPLLPYGFLSALGLVGMILLRNQFPRLFLLYAFPCLYLLSALIFFPASRYRLPATPFLALFAAFTILSLFQWWRKKELGPFFRIAGLSILLGAASHFSFYSERQKVDRWQKATRLHYSLGGGFFYQRGLYPQAIGELERAIQLEPGFIPAYNLLGMAYAHLRNWEKAEENFRKVIALAPGIDQGYMNLGLLYYLQNEKEKARPLFEKALALNPQNSRAKKFLEALTLRPPTR